MTKNTISASEFLAFQSTSMANHLPKYSGGFKATSVRMPSSLDAEVETIAMLTSFSKNQIVTLLIQSGIEMYLSDIEGTEVHQEFLKIKQSKIKEGEYK